jgi:nicotinamide-nucleotide amidase
MLHRITVDIITIGDELLIGQIIDTNSAYIAKELTKSGFSINHIHSVSDNREAIIEAIHRSFQQVDVLILTGGLGPTKDDITKKVLCEYFNTKLVFSEEVYNDVQDILAYRPNAMNGLNRQQAYVPESCRIIRNKVGTAPIMWFEKDNKILVSMPGVPNEMKWAMEHAVIEKLQNYFQLPSIVHQHILVYGYPESVLAETLEEWENNLPSCMSLAYLPSMSHVKLRISAIEDNAEILFKQMQEQVALLEKILGKAIIAFEDKPLERLLSNWLLDNNLTLSVAESCTGGNIARLVTSVEGSSMYFKGGVIAYANEIKEQVLAVSTQSLKEYGAVSQQVVEQMARGVMQLTNSDVAIATSGIAGPSGGTDNKPVGTVWVAVCNRHIVKSHCFSFGGIRERVIERASYAGMIMLKELIEYTSPK